MRILFGFLLLLSNLAYGDVLGTWAGDVIYTDGTGLSMPCKMEVILYKSPGQIEYQSGVRGGYEECEWDESFTLNVEQNNLFDWGVKVGQIKEDSFVIKGVDVGEGFYSKLYYNVEMHLQADGKMSFEDGHDWISSTGPRKDSVKGILTKQ